MEALGSIDQAVERAIPAIQICHYKPGTMDPSGPNRDMFYKLTKSPSYPFVRYLQCKMGLHLLTERFFTDRCHFTWSRISSIYSSNHRPPQKRSSSRARCRTDFIRTVRGLRSGQTSSHRERSDGRSQI